MRTRLALLPVVALLLTACAIPLRRPAPSPRPAPNAPAPAAPPTPAPAAPGGAEPAPADGAVPAQPDGAGRAPSPGPAMPAPVGVGPAAVFDRFLDAVQRGNAPAAWDLLSQQARRELGGSPDAFVTHALPWLRERFSGWTGYRVALSRTVSPQVAAVAITAERPGLPADVIAVALVNEAYHWRVSLTQFPITPLPPVQPGIVSYRTAETAVLADRLWLDDIPLSPSRSGPTVSARVPPDLAPGPHVAVALAIAATGTPTAYGWIWAYTPR